MISESAKPTLIQGRTALVTGATAGIGLAIATRLAHLGAHLIITGRRQERLGKIREQLQKEHGVRVETLQFDITDRRATEKALAQAPLSEVSILVNNAGLALGLDPMQTANLDHWDQMIDTNIKGLLYVTRLCLPHLLKRGEGHIINLGSVAGRFVYPSGGVYCATKFAVRALSEGLRFDLLGTAIRVTNIEPGMVESEFSEVRYGGDRAKAAQVYWGMQPLTPHDIAETVAWCLQCPAHVNIQELVVYPTCQASVGAPYVHREPVKV